MSMSRMRRATSVAALAVTASSGITVVAAAGPAAAAAARTATSLSIRVAHHAVNPGGGDTVIGDLHARHGRAAGQVVVLQAKSLTGTAWAREGAQRTGRRGHVAFHVAPVVPARYRLVFDGTPALRPSHSAVARVRVRDTTSLTISAASRSIAPGESDTVRGELGFGGAPLADQPITLRARSADERHFADAASATTAADGSVVFPVTPQATTHYRLVFPGSDTAPRARSAVTTVHVRSDCSLSIRTMQRGHYEVVRGVLRANGHRLADRRVMLQSRPAGTGDWTATATSRTHRRGAVRFVEQVPASSEDYQLTYPGGLNYNGCDSGVVTVNVSTG